MARVSILIPAYNAEEIILRALDSAQSQTRFDNEILVIDDASTDRTVELVEQRAARDGRIRLIKRATNGGPAVARNIGLCQAQGEWIALLDADDAMAAERLERLLPWASDEDVLVADNLEMYDFQAQEVSGIAIDPEFVRPELRLDCEGFVERCHTNQPGMIDFGLLKPLIRTSHIRKHGIWYDENARHGEDFRFYLDALLAGGSMLVVPEAYYRYTERVGSISHKKSGVSRTNARYDVLVAYTQMLAADGRYSSVAGGLQRRADALRKSSKVASFRKHSKLGKIVQLPRILADPEMHGYIGSALRARLGRMYSSS